MERDRALVQLPRAHSIALRLDEIGAGPCLIADCLGIELEAVGPLLQVAEAKLARIQRDDG